MTYLIKFNKEELGLGAAFGLAFWPVLGLKVIALSILCAVLWAVGGSGYGRVWRYLGAPVAAFAFLAVSGLAQQAFWGLWPCVVVLTFGYGIPDPPTRPDRDEGSLLGRIFYKIAGGQEVPANIMTRAAYAALLCIGPSVAITGLWPAFLLLIPASIAAVLLLEGEITI